MDENLRKLRDTMIQFVFVFVVIIGFEYICFSQIINNSIGNLKYVFILIGIISGALVLYMYNTQLNSAVFKKVLKNFLAIMSVILTVFNAQFYNGYVDGGLIFVVLPLVLNLIPIISDFFSNCVDLKKELELGQTKEDMEARKRLELEMRALEEEKKRLEVAQKIERFTLKELELINEKLDYLLTKK